MPIKPPKKVKAIQISPLLGFERSAGIVTGSTTVNTGVVSFKFI